jgi:hypothetical protein
VNADVHSDQEENSDKKITDAASNQSQFEGCWSVGERVGDDKRKDIHFKIHCPECPPVQQTFKNEVEKFLTALKIIYPKSGTEESANFSEAFSKLLALTRVGLVGKEPNTIVGMDALSSLKSDIFEREAGRIKNSYMIKFGFRSFPTFFFFLLLYFSVTYGKDFVPPQIYSYRNFFLLCAGTTVGVWASFATRKVTLEFYDLINLEEDRLDPTIRVLFSVVLSSVLGLIFVTGFADVILGSFRASSLLKSGSTAILVGALAGISEKALPAAVMQHSQSFIQGKRNG